MLVGLDAELRPTVDHSDQAEVVVRRLLLRDFSK